MSSAPASAAALGAAEGEALLGMAALGKTALALLLVIGLILLCSWLLRRLASGQRLAGGPLLRVRGSALLGPRERVVVVEVEGTWLVLGVTPGQVSKLHELPAPPAAALADSPDPSLEGSFAQRLTQALGHNLRRSGSRQP